MNMRNKLEWEANRIETVLAVHKLPARVTGGTVTPRWVRFKVLPAVGAKISRIKSLSEELAAALDVSTCRVSRRGAAVAIEVPRDDPQPVRLLPLYQQLTGQGTPVPPIAAILGLAENGAPLLIRLPSPDVAHILVAGTTGSGKTVLLQTMILSLAMSNKPDDLQLVLIDPKGHAFSPFASLPHLARPVIREVGEAVEALNSLMKLMEYWKTREHSPSIVVFIDELADLLMVGGKPVQYALTRLTQRGREADIHIVAATQKPTSAVLGPLVKANFPVRLVGRVTSVEDARVASGWSGTGAERLTGQGDFLAVAEGRVSRFQVAHVSRDEIRKAVAELPGSAEECSRPPRSRAGGDTRASEDTQAARAVIKPIISLPWPAGRLTEVLRESQPVNQPVNPRSVNGDLALAQVLIHSDLWDGRQHLIRAGDYRWGWPTLACKMLFGQSLVGNWHSRTVNIIELAEQISNSTTSNTEEEPGNGRKHHKGIG